MNLTNYLTTFKGAVETNRYSRYLIFLLLISNVVLGIAVSSKSTTVVMVPPNLEADAWVSSTDGSMSLRESWATYVAMMLGNVTPRSVTQVGPVLSKLIYPGAYKEVMEHIAVLKKEVETEQLEIQFSPTGVFNIPSQNKVAVSGEFRMRSARGGEKRFIRTYVIGVNVRNYQPSVVSIEILEGAYKPGQLSRKEGN